VRFAPDGRVDRIVKLPVQRPTCCVFGPPGSTTRYITSAAFELHDDPRQPWAGSLLAIDAGVPGVARLPFEG